MNFNLAVILHETALASPDRAVVVYAGGQLSYADLDAMSSRLAAGLESAGIGPGDLVGLQLPNIPQFLIAYFGILKAGAVVVPLNVMLKPPEIAFHLSDSAAKLLITWEGILADAVKGAEVAGVRAVYAVGHPARIREPRPHRQNPPPRLPRTRSASARSRICSPGPRTGTSWPRGR